jgi:hypothetical protein
VGRAQQADDRPRQCLEVLLIWHPAIGGDESVEVRIGSASQGLAVLDPLPLLVADGFDLVPIDVMAEALIRALVEQKLYAVGCPEGRTLRCACSMAVITCSRETVGNP